MNQRVAKKIRKKARVLHKAILSQKRFGISYNDIEKQLKTRYYKEGVV